MLAFALRRAIWAIPTLFGVSLVVFLLTTLLPEPSAFEEAPSASAQLHVDDRRRAQFLDLPRFFNVAPEDVRTRVEACLRHVAAADGESELAALKLARIGGAGLPYVLPRLGTFPPVERGRIALALAPIARRMQLGDETTLGDPDRAVVFWTHFWDDRSVDFTDPAAHRAVQRIATRESDLSRQDLVGVDTFALAEIFAILPHTKDARALHRLTSIASRVTERYGVVPEDADPAAVRQVVSGWMSWWFVYRTQYVGLSGGEKVTATLTETRYAKWVLGAATGKLGLSTRDGLPVFDKLASRAKLTLSMTLLALLVSMAAAIPLGVLTAWRRGHAVDVVTALVLFGLYSIPTFLVAELLATFGSAKGAGYILPVLALATVSLSVMTQQQRASTIEALGEDYVRTARAKGARTLRVAVVHALRNALVPTITLAGVQFPTLLGAAFVVEEVFGVQGMGWETLRALEARDAAWIVAVTLLSAAVTTVSIVGTDVTYGLLDPRVRERHGRRSA